MLALTCCAVNIDKCNIIRVSELQTAARIANKQRMSNVLHVLLVLRETVSIARYCFIVFQLAYISRVEPVSYKLSVEKLAILGPFFMQPCSCFSLSLVRLFLLSISACSFLKF